MADRRKLQGEIDKCLKKVTEGVDSFEDTWKKLHVSNNSNQKDKYESDLKKEIKKLQRLRDQIKTWLTSSDIKDKKGLQDSKKLIETQMERFKIVEKETKIKAYSKEGLGAALKVDPAQRERDETSAWLSKHVDELNIEVDKFESEIEAINVNTKKKKMDKEKLERCNKLQDSQAKHKYHITQLEALLRMLDNGTVEVDQIKQIQEDVEHYCENSQDPDFQENDYIYEDLKLESFDEYLTRQAVPNQQSLPDLKNGAVEEENSTILSNSSVSTASNSRSQTPFSENLSSEECKTTTAPIPVQQPTPTSSASSSSDCIVSTHTHANIHNGPAVINSQTSSNALYASAVAGLPNNFIKTSSHEDAWATSSSLSRETTNEGDTKPFHSSLSSNVLHNNVNHVPASISMPLTESIRYPPHQGSESTLQHNSCDPLELNYSDSRLHALMESDKQMLSSVIRQSDSTRSFTTSQSFGASSMPVIHTDTQLSLESLTERSLLNARLNSNAQNLSLPRLQNIAFQATHNTSFGGNPDAFSVPLNTPPPRGTANINISQIFGSFPENSLADSQRHTLKVLEAVQKHLPQPMDSQRRRYARPGGPANSPDYYPTTAPKGNTIDFFKQLSNETLFFIFYYLEGTKAQYFAAKALKTKSWRFHTMFMMWFQRHEQPKNVTDEFEQGTYLCFDYEKWKEEKKEGFTFEYKYLEDKDLSEN